MNIFFFFASKLSPRKNDDGSEQTLEELIAYNRGTNHYWAKERGKYFNDCPTYIVGMAKSILKKIDSKHHTTNCNSYKEIKQFDLIVYAHDINLHPEEAAELDKLSKKPIIDVPYKKSDNSEDIIKKIYDKANAIFEGANTVYIATNGGLRSNVLFFSTFAHILKCRNITTKLFYEEQDTVRFYKDDENVETDENGVVEEKGDLTVEVADYYDLLRCVEVFTTTGNPLMLKLYFKGEQNDNIKELLDYMTNFHQDLQVCRKVGFNGLIDNYNKLVRKLEDMEGMDGLPVTFRLLIPKIKNSFVDGKVKEIEKKLDEMSKGKGAKLELLHIVKWCINNALIVQGYLILQSSLFNFFTNSDGKGLNIISISNGYPSKEELIELIKKQKLLTDSTKCNNNPNSAGDDENKRVIDKIEKFYEWYKQDSQDNSPIIKLIYSWALYSSMVDESESEMSLSKKFHFSNQNIKDCRKAIQLVILVRNLRNCIAHPEKYIDALEEGKGLTYRFVCLESLIKEYEEKSGGKSVLYNIEDGKMSISNKAENFYNISSDLLEWIFADVKQLCLNYIDNIK